MNESQFVRAWLLPEGINVYPQEIIVDVADVPSILTVIGGEATTVEAASFYICSDDNQTVLLGLMDEEAEVKATSPHGMNLLASVLLDVSEPLFGNVVIIGCMPEGVSDPDDMDGNLYDVPDWVIDLGDSVTVKAADMWNEMMETIQHMAKAFDAGVLDGDALIDILHNQDATALEELAQRSFDALEQLEQVDDTQFIADVEKFLQEGGE